MMENNTTTEEISDIRIFDTPVVSLPEDLYIPPQAFAIWLEQFAGPLDFLLYLVKKNNFDLTEMAILPITEQYLEYIQNLDETYFELVGDYLLMASTLIAIKSELLLPHSPTVEDEKSPKARLIQRLEEYAQIKEASKRIDKLLRLERDVFLAFVNLPNADAIPKNTPSYSPNLLVNSLVNMQLKPDYQMHIVKIDPVLLPERIAMISRTLSEKGSGVFHELLDKQQGKMGVVVSFVAVLELIKRELIGFNQDNKTQNEEIDEAIDEHKITGQTLYWLH